MIYQEKEKGWPGFNLYLNNQVSNWDVDKLDHITNNTHHDETKTDSSDELQVFLLGRLGTLLNKTCTVPHKLHWSFCNLFYFCHCCVIILLVIAGNNEVCSRHDTHIWPNHSLKQFEHETKCGKIKCENRAKLNQLLRLSYCLYPYACLTRSKAPYFFSLPEHSLSSMSCEDEHFDHHNHHQHHHHHLGDDAHTHPPHEPELTTSAGQSLLPWVDLPGVVAHNAQAAFAAPLVFRTHAQRFDLAPGQLTPDHRFGPDLLLTIPLIAPCRLFSVILRFSVPPEAPVKCVLYKNTLPDLQQAARGAIKPLHECTQPAQTAVHCEHHVPRRKFAGTTKLALYFPEIPQSTSLVCVELRGESSKLAKSSVPTGLKVETAPRLEDHITAGKDEAFTSSLNIQ